METTTIKTNKRITIAKAKASILDVCEGDKLKALRAYRIMKEMALLQDLYTQELMLKNNIEKNK